MKKLIYQILISFSIILFTVGMITITSCDSSTSSNNVDHNTGNATVIGNLMLPAAALSKTWAVLANNDFNDDTLANPPSNANAVYPSLGTVTFDITLSVIS